MIRLILATVIAQPRVKWPSLDKTAQGSKE
jgi:hypothetical protein